MGNLYNAESDALRAYFDRANNLAKEVYTSIVEIMKRHPNKDADFTTIDNSPFMFERYDDSEIVTVERVMYNEDEDYIEVAGSAPSNLTIIFCNDEESYADLGLALRILDRLIENEELLFDIEDDFDEDDYL